jgi:hypothetical protein
MTMYRYLNKTGYGGNHTTWWILQAMIDAGWTVSFSGSGVGGVYSGGDVFTHSGGVNPKQYSLITVLSPIGSAEWGYRSCYVILKAPTGNMQIGFWRSTIGADTSDDEWYIGYSPAGTYGSGQVAGTDYDEDTMPAATDEYAIYGSRVSFPSIFGIGGTANLLQVAADDAASPNGIYGVFCVELIATNTVKSVFAIDDLRNAPSAHPHAVVFLAGASPVITAAVIGTGGAGVKNRTVFDYGGTPTWNGVPYNTIYNAASGVVIPNGGGVDADGYERGIAPSVGYYSSEGYMGTSRWVRWPAISRAYPNTGVNETYLYVNDGLVANLLDGVTTPANI